MAEVNGQLLLWFVLICLCTSPGFYCNLFSNGLANCNRPPIKPMRAAFLLAGGACHVFLLQPIRVTTVTLIDLLIYWLRLSCVVFGLQLW